MTPARAAAKETTVHDAKNGKIIAYRLSDLAI